MNNPIPYLKTRLKFLEDKPEAWERYVEIKEALRYAETGECLYTGNVLKGEFKNMEIKEYLETLDAETFKFVASRMIAKQYGIINPIPLTGGSCTSQNCFGTTGCHPLTKNGECECQSPDGPCVWVPAT